MITVKQKVNLIEATFGLPKISSSGKNATVFCPVCESNGKSNKLKLSISLDTGVYHCWVCESKGKNIETPNINAVTRNFPGSGNLSDFQIIIPRIIGGSTVAR